MAKTKRQYSVTEYAEKLHKTRAGIFYMINKKKLPLGVHARRVGRTYFITDNSDKYGENKESQQLNQIYNIENE